MGRSLRFASHGVALHMEELLHVRTRGSTACDGLESEEQSSNQARWL